MAQTVLFIEDETAIADSVSYSLEKEGFSVLTAEDGLSGLATARNQSPDLIILDLMLPNLSGIDVCKAIRQESSVPIIILTAKGEEVDRIVGLELGADDYVTKPFSIRELIARVRAVLRRAANSKTENSQMVLRAGRISVDLACRKVTVDDTPVHLPVKQFDLLRIFLTNQDKVLTREFLLQAVWDSEASLDTGTLDVHIRWLREKLEDNPSHPRYIRTIRRIGYKFVADTD